MKKILVTGTEGDVGKVLLPQLAKKHDATGFDIRPHTGTMKTIQGDLTKYEDIAPALEGVEAVAHLAALLPRPKLGPGPSVDLNVKATATLLHAAVEKKVRRFVYCSTVWATGQGSTEPYLPIDEETPCAPVCMYGQTKWMGELMTEWYARQRGLEVVIIRFCGFNAVKGYDADGRIDWPNADVKGIFLRYLSGNPKLMNPVDLGVAFGQAVENPAAVGQRFVVGCYQPYVAADAAGLRSMPAVIVEKYYPGVPKFLEELGIPIPPMPYFYCYEKARTRLGFRSQHDLGDGVRLYKEWRGCK
jgi:nucleoside-diphosphate-sugar epimerase